MISSDCNRSLNEAKDTMKTADQHSTNSSRSLSRREVLKTLPALGLTPWFFRRQASGPPIRVERLHSFGLRVRDLDRSVEFYQGLFGMPIQARQGPTVCLRIGAGPQFLALTPTAAGQSPSISHICLTTEDFDAERLMGILETEGIRQREPPESGGGLDTAMQSWIRMRGSTPEVYFTDPLGLVIQLQDPGYCGGSGALGNMCPPPEAAPSSGLLELEDLNHFTIFVSDAGRANQFYEDLFGLSVQATQGPGMTGPPLLGVGDGIQFIMFGGGGGRGRGGAAPPPTPASINHVCLNLEDFDTGRVLAALTEYGVQPRDGGGGRGGPMVHYISTRTEARGGAPEGTPELYFTDPDGLLLQLQDTSYCGGSGVLGNVCP